MAIRILGLDPGLRHTGWGVIDKEGSSVKYVASGVINPNEKLPLSERLSFLHQEITKIIKKHNPDEASVEEVFVNMNPVSTLKLGQARGVVLLTPALHHISVSEYTPNQIKKMIVGVGHAEKSQVELMVHVLLKTAPKELKPDESDALAIALCHSFLRKAIV